MSQRIRIGRIVPLFLLVVACGPERRVDGSDPSTSGDEQDAGPAPDGGPVVRDAGHEAPAGYPAPFPDPPQAVSSGGPVLESARFVPVFFSNDTPSMVESLTDLDTRFGQTDLWRAMTAEYCYRGSGTATAPEYCIGPATATAAVTLPSSELTSMGGSTISSYSIDSWLRGKLNSRSAALPAPDENTVYVLHFPTGVTITMQGGYASCREFGGYHSDTQLSISPRKVAYAVIPRCSSFGGYTGLDAVSIAESHELLEAATDPYPNQAPAFSTVDQAHLAYALIGGGGEVGDLCTQEPDGFAKFDGFPYVVQRGWSNAAARAGHNPCVPALPGEVYFNTVAELADVVNVQGYGQFSGVNLAAGQSRTVTLDLYSDDVTSGPWQVEAVDASYLFGETADLGLTLGAQAGSNGDRIALTIEAPARATSRFRAVQILSRLANVRRTSWIVVGVR